MSDLDARCFVRRGYTLVPADFAAEEMLTEIKEGSEIMVSVRKARSPKHHRWFFALLRIVRDNTDDRWMTEEDLLEDLKLSVGHTTKRVNLLTGETIAVPRSISFAAMDQTRFKRFVNRALYVLGHVLGVAPETLMAETTATQPGPPFKEAA